MGIRHSSVWRVDVKVKHLLSELHTNLVQVGTSLVPKCFSLEGDRLLPGGSSGFTGISWDAEICHGFPPPQAVLATVAPGEKVI